MCLLNYRYFLTCIILFVFHGQFFGQIQVQIETTPPSINDTITICEGNTVTFTDSSQNVPPNANYTWSFPGGNPANATGPGPHTVEYSVAGNYVAELEVDGEVADIDIVVNTSPTAVINLNGTSWSIVNINGIDYIARCGTSSSPISFNIQTPGQSNQSSHEIIWGDGNTTSLNGIQTGNQTNTYSAGTYEMIYVYTNEFGCSDTVVNNIFIGLSPNAGIQFSSGSVCIPGDFEYELTNFSNNPNGTTYTISFTDGSPPVQFQHPPPALNTHIFQSSSCGSGSNNQFFGNLMVENVCGQSQVENFGPITVFESVTAQMSIVPDSIVCAGSNVTISDESDSGINITANGCSSDYAIYWEISPSSGYTINNGVLGDNAGFPNFFDFWNEGSPQLDIAFNDPGVYEITLFAGNSYDCGYDSIVQTICVVPPLQPNYIINDSVSCAPFELNITNLTSTPDCGINNIFDWSITQNNPANCVTSTIPGYEFINGTNNNSINPEILFSSPGIYELNLSLSLDANVPGSQCLPVNTTQTITIKDKPSAEIPEIIACEGLNYLIEATNINNCYADSALTFDWQFPPPAIATNTNGFQPEVSYPSPGNYSYSLTLTNECGDTSLFENVLIEESVIVTVSAPPVACANEPIQLNGTISGGVTSGQWSSSVPGGSFSAVNDLNPIYTPPTGYVGVIEFTLTSDTPAGPCPFVFETVSVLIELDATVDAGSYPPACIGQNIQLNGSFGGAASQITWSSLGGGTFSNVNSTNAIFTPPAGFTGQIDLVIETDDPPGSCLPASDTVTIFITPLPNITTSPDTTICEGDEVNISAFGGVSYSWDSGLGAGQSHLVGPTVNTTYNVIGVDANGCENTDQVIISVIPSPVIDAVPNQEVCDNEPTSEVVFSGLPAGVAFEWSNSNPNIGLPSTSGTGNFPSFNATNTTNDVLSTTVTVIPDALGCLGLAETFDIIVNPTPEIINNDNQQEICPGLSSEVVWLSNLVGGLSVDYSWEEIAVGPNINGQTTSGIGNLPQMSLTNGGNSPESVVFEVTPSFNGCEGPPFLYTIIVNPGPVMDPISPQEICSGDSFLTPVFSSSVSGITYTWTLTNTNIPADVTGYPAPNGNGNINGTTVTNGGTDPYTLVYEVVPNIAGFCSGNPEFFELTVQPEPQTNFSLVEQTICTETSSAAINLTSPTSGVDFEWTATAPAGVNGVNPGSGTNNTVPVYTIENTTNTPQTITIEGTATTQSGGCVGLPSSATIIVLPSPVADTISDFTVCNGDLNAAFNFTGVATGYDWSNNNTATGIANSANDVSSFDAFTATNGGTSPISSTITVTPLYELNGTTCQGANTSFVVTVNPSPQENPTMNIEACNGDSINATLFSTINTLGTTTYTWTNDNTAIGLAASGSGNIPAFIGTNTSATSITATITVTPTFTHNGVLCIGNPETFTITVNPTPVLNPISNETVCNNQSTPLVNFVAAGATDITWTNNLTSIGLGGSGSGNIPSFTAVNNTSSPVTADITVSSFYNTNNLSCAGNIETFTITVNPTPTVNPVGNQIVCHNDTTTSVSFTGNVAGTTYNWTNSNTGIGLTSPTGSNILPSFTGSNTTNDIVSTTITVTPTAQICAGLPTSFDIIVNPTPQITNTVLQQEICSGITDSVVWISNLAASLSTNFEWEILNQGSTINGFIPNGTGNLPQMTLLNSGLVPDTITFAVTPSFNGCDGTPVIYTIIVNPGPVMDPISPQEICSGDSFSTVNFSSNISSTTFNWTLLNTNLPLNLTGYPQPSGSGAIVGSTIENTASTPITLNYEVTPTSFGCAGAPQNFQLTINPELLVDFSIPNQTICDGSNSQVVNLSSNVPGVNIIWEVDSIPAGLNGINILNGNSSIPSYNLINTTSQAITFTLTVQALNPVDPTFCPGQEYTYSITVNPAPTINSVQDLFYCSGGSNNEIVFTGTGNLYEWEHTTPIIGIPSSGSDTIPSLTLQNNSNSPITSGFTVTPFFINNNITCSGPPTQFEITVNPIGQVNAIPNVILCNSDSVAQVPFVSANTGGNNTYAWSNNNTSTGLNAGGVTPFTPSFIGNNNSNTPNVSEVEVTPTFTAFNLSCVGNSEVFSITVNPTPVFNQLNDTLICNNTQLSYTPSTNVNSLFSWQGLPNPNVNNITTNSQNSFIIQDSLSNTSSIPQIVDYLVTPISFPEGCVGDQGSFEVTVQPDIIMTSPTSYEICSGTLVNSVLSSNIPSTYTWFATNNPNVSGASTFINSGNIINDVLINNTTSPQLVVYTVIPTSIDGGCQGAPLTVSVIVNPELQIISSSNEFLCSGDSLNVPLAANASGTFTWFANTNAGVTGQTTSIQTTNVISDQLINLTNSLQTVTYNIVVTSSNQGCTSQNFIMTVDVAPTPNLDPLSDITLCQGDSQQTITPTGVVNSYNWTNNNTAIGLPSFATNTTNVPGFVAQNNNNFPISSEVVITPIYEHNGQVCFGAPDTLEITVNPNGQVNSIINEELCDGDTYAGTVFSTQNTNGNTSYSWTNNNLNTGLNLTSGTGNLPSFSAENNTNQPISSTISITPSFENNGVSCTSLPISFDIIVNPTPMISPVNNFVLCNGDQFNGTVFNGSGANDFFWTNTNPSIGLPSSGFGNLPQFTAVNNSNQPVTATFEVTPIFNSSISSNFCFGTPVVFTITINPTPFVAAISNQEVCNGQLTNEVIFSGNLNNATYTWVNSNTGIGLTQTNGVNLLPSFSAINNTNDVATTNITVTPELNGCFGPPEQFEISVLPVPSITNNPNEQIVCSGQSSNSVSWQTNLNPSLTVNYTWELITQNNNVTGQLNSGLGNLPIMTLNNLSSATQTISYAVSPNIEGCEGSTYIYNIQVLPNPTIQPILPQEICSGDLSTTTSFVSNVGGTNFQWELSNINNIPNTTIGYPAPNGVGNIPSAVIENNGTTDVTLSYLIYPELGGCIGTPETFLLTVSPNPSAIYSIPDQTICSGDQSNQVVISSPTPNTNIAWSVNNIPQGLSGLNSTNGVEVIPSYNLTNSLNTPITITFNIEISNELSGCQTDSIYQITVLPAPVFTPSSLEICSGETLSINLGANNPSNFSWEAVPNLSVSGSSIFPQNSNVISDELNNLTTTNQTQYYLVTPISVNGNCVGNTDTITVTVFPQPIARFGDNIQPLQRRLLH